MSGHDARQFRGGNASKHSIRPARGGHCTEECLSGPCPSWSKPVFQLRPRDVSSVAAYLRSCTHRQSRFRFDEAEFRLLRTATREKRVYAMMFEGLKLRPDTSSAHGVSPAVDTNVVIFALFRHRPNCTLLPTASLLFAHRDSGGQMVRCRALGVGARYRPPDRCR
jgi:hypothetical protein